MFQQMQYFITIVNEHSFTRAAETCHISQSAISQQMKELEARLGVKLLTRQGRSFEVTEAGRYFYTHSQMILKDVAQLVDATVQLAHADAAELRIGYLRSFGTVELRQTVAEFVAKFPQVKVKISSGTHEELYELLRTDQIDLNFADQRRALSNEFQNEFLTASDYVVAVNRGLPVDTKPIETSDLADLPCIVVANPQQLAAETAYYRDILGVQSEFSLATNNDEAQMMIASNQGYLITDRRAQSLLDQTIVKTIPLVRGGRKLRQNYYAYWKADNSGYYVESFAELLKAKF